MLSGIPSTSMVKWTKTDFMSWLALALLSAFAAALVAIFGKLGLKGVDSTLATTLRAGIMFAFLAAVSIGWGKFKNFSFADLSRRDWWLIFLSAIAGALSWLFYFFALKIGPAGKVAVVDRLSLVFVVLMAAVFLGERLNFYAVVGTLLIVAGAILFTLK